MSAVDGINIKAAKSTALDVLRIFDSDVLAMRVGGVSTLNDRTMNLMPIVDSNVWVGSLVVNNSARIEVESPNASEWHFSLVYTTDAVGRSMARNCAAADTGIFNCLARQCRGGVLLEHAFAIERPLLSAVFLPNRRAENDNFWSLAILSAVFIFSVTVITLPPEFLRQVYETLLPRGDLLIANSIMPFSLGWLSSMHNMLADALQRSPFCRCFGHQAPDNEPSTEQLQPQQPALSSAELELSMRDVHHEPQQSATLLAPDRTGEDCMLEEERPDNIAGELVSYALLQIVGNVIVATHCENNI